MPFASRRMSAQSVTGFICLVATLLGSALPGFAQSVCLPAPRLLTTMPMGGTAGSQVTVTVTGENLDNVGDLLFSDPHLKATPKLDANGKPEPNRFVVTIAADCPIGLHEARLTSRLGISSSRIFSVGSLPETMVDKPNTSLATAFPLAINSLCNAVITNRAVDFFSFEAKAGQRLMIDLAARGIDSKLDPVLIVADAAGRDLKVERRSGVLDFAVPSDGKYVIKVHELTFKGGPAYFYRLSLKELKPDEALVRHPSTKPVNAFSWPPQGLKDQADVAEVEPNNQATQAQKITLPCDIAGAFATAADVDLYQFEAKKGEVWWIEVGSERFRLPTDPAVLVQQVTGTGADEKVTDIAEFSDIPSPVKVSSNGYAYDGPPYDAGTSDVLGKLVIPSDGVYRLQITDLFGGTRTDPRNIYRLVIRKAAPDFALVAWAQHMELRNGDRNALSKPLALRGGSTMALEVIAIRRDGFVGDIEIAMDGLPEGVTAKGLKIPAGASRGLMLVSASPTAARAFGSGHFYGKATIDGKEVVHPCQVASMAWPIPDAWGEIPSPRLMADVPVSVSGYDFSPITIAAAKNEVWTITAGGSVTIPLALTRRSEFSGASMQAKPIGPGFEAMPAIELPLNADASQVVIDTAKLKLAPGDYLLALQGPAVAKYRHNLDQLMTAETTHKQAMDQLKAVESELAKANEAVQAAAVDQKEAAKKTADELQQKQKAAAAAVATAAEQLKNATAVSQPRDIVDIVVSEPIAVRVQPAEAK